MTSCAAGALPELPEAPSPSVSQSTTGYSPVQQVQQGGAVVPPPTPGKEPAPAKGAEPAPAKGELPEQVAATPDAPASPVQQGGSPVQEGPVAPVKGPKPKPKPTPKPKPAAGGGGAPKPKPKPIDTTTVHLTNHDRNSEVKLTSSKGTSVEISGDPHVRTVVNGTTQAFDIGYGAGEIRLADGTAVKWDTWHNASHALLDFSIDGPGKERDVAVSTNDGKDVEHELTNLTDAQLREFIAKLAQYKGAWNQPLRHT